MVVSRSSNVWESYVASQCQSFEKARESDQPKKLIPFVTISRQAGAGGITVGEKLVAYLQEHDKEALCPWTLFDRNLISQVLGEHNLPQDFSKFMPEDKVSEVQDMMEELFGLHPSEWSLVHKTSQTILHLAQMGNVILVGRGANVITRKFLSTGFHVRLIGSLEMRIRHIQDYYRLKRDDAIDFIRTEDGGRKRYLKQNFDKDINDPLLYDVIIDTDFISYDDAARIIGEETLRIRKMVPRCCA